MKKLILVALVMLFTVATNAQDSLNVEDKDGLSNTLKIVLIVLAFLLPIIIWLWSKREKSPAGSNATVTKSTSTSWSGYTFYKVSRFILGIIAYVLFVFAIKSMKPDYWEAWHTPPETFWITNAFLLVCVIAMSLTVKLAWGFWGTILIVGGLLFWYFPKTVKENQPQIVYTPPKVVIRQPVVQPENSDDGGDDGKIHNPLNINVNGPKTARTFHFSDYGSKIPVYLWRGWKTYPKGGSIVMTTPEGKILIDQPGVNKDVGDQPSGWYSISPEEGSKAWGIEIYNTWWRKAPQNKNSQEKY